MAASFGKLLLITGLGLAGITPAFGATSVEFEAGLVLPGYNNVAVPGGTGTRFSLTEDLRAQRPASFRLRIGHDLGEQHWLALLAAPLRLRSRGRFDSDVTFNGREFAAGDPIQADYRFDSYRLIYRYRWHQGETFRFSIGAALKLRDADIRLSSGDIRSSKSNTGLVPLLSVGLHWRLADAVVLLIDGEALAAPQGRAEDLLFAARYAASERLQWTLGYRVLEGGADNDEVYSFSLFHFLVAGLRWTW